MDYTTSESEEHQKKMKQATRLLSLYTPPVINDTSGTSIVSSSLETSKCSCLFNHNK